MQESGVINMTRRTRTILGALRSYLKIRQAEHWVENWNQAGHPKPKLPGQTYLEEEYLESVRSTATLKTYLEAAGLVHYVGKERGG